MPGFESPWTEPYLGCMFFGTKVPADTAYQLLDAYVAAGGRFVDTANNYAAWVPGGTGDESELLLGEWLRRRGGPGEVLISTKLGARAGRSSYGDWQGLSAPAVRDQLHGSLNRLGVDHVDLLYAHIDDRTVPLAETLGAFGDLVAEGLVGAVGASNLTADRLREAHSIAPPGAPAGYRAVQQRTTYLTPRPDADFGVQVLLDDDLRDYAAGQGVTVFGYSVTLAGGYEADDRVPAEYRQAGTAAELAAVRQVAAGYGLSPSQVALAWVRAQGVVPVLGVSRPSQLEEGLAAQAVTLDEPALAALARARAAR